MEEALHSYLAFRGKRGRKEGRRRGKRTFYDASLPLSWFRGCSVSVQVSRFCFPFRLSKENHQHEAKERKRDIKNCCTNQSVLHSPLSFPLSLYQHIPPSPLIITSVIITSLSLSLSLRTLALLDHSHSRYFAIRGASGSPRGVRETQCLPPVFFSVLSLRNLLPLVLPKPREQISTLRQREKTERERE